MSSHFSEIVLTKGSIESEEGCGRAGKLKGVADEPLSASIKRNPMHRLNYGEKVF